MVAAVVVTVVAVVAVVLAVVVPILVVAMVVVVLMAKLGSYDLSRDLSLGFCFLLKFVQIKKVLLIKLQSFLPHSCNDYYGVPSMITIH